MALEDELREVCGKAIGITLWRTKTGEWQANVSRDKQSWNVGIDPDPATALRSAIEQNLRRKSAPPAPAAKSRSVFD